MLYFLSEVSGESRQLPKRCIYDKFENKLRNTLNIKEIIMECNR